MFRFVFVDWVARIPISDRLSSNFCATGTNGGLHFSLSLLTFSDPCITDHAKCGRSPSNYNRLWRVLFLEAQLTGCLREPEGIPLEWKTASGDNAQSVIKHTFGDASVSATTPYWCAVPFSRVDQRYSKAAVRDVLALAPHPDPANRRNRGTRAYSFMENASKKER